MKRILIFISMIFVLQGWHTEQKIQNSTITNILPHKTATITSINDGILSKSTPEYSDIYNIGIPPKTGQSSILRITQKEFLSITQKELVDYLNSKKECNHHDWHAIVIDGNHAILCSYNQNEFIYGKWDDSLGITEKLVTNKDPSEFFLSIAQLSI